MPTLPYLLQQENICRIESDRILIGDRRVFPFEKTFAACSSVEQVATALQQMVTQGGGPLQVALTTMRFVAREMALGRLPFSFAQLQQSVETLCASRPTNTTMRRTLHELLSILKPNWSNTRNTLDRLEQEVSRIEQYYDEVYMQMGLLGSSLIEDGDVVLTTCFAEHTFLLSLAYGAEAGKRVHVLVPETRPYLQGARLTAPSLVELGIDCEVITDGMGATMLSTGQVKRYMTASDVVCMDGTVVNKIGTLANALAAFHFGVPYYAFSISPDPTKMDRQAVHMEERNADEVLLCRGLPTTQAGIKARYPAFDIIPSSLVTGIVTPKGVLAPDQIRGRFL